MFPLEGNTTIFGLIIPQAEISERQDNKMNLISYQVDYQKEEEKEEDEMTIKVQNFQIKVQNCEIGIIQMDVFALVSIGLPQFVVNKGTIVVHDFSLKGLSVDEEALGTLLVTQGAVVC